MIKAAPIVEAQTLYTADGGTCALTRVSMPGADTQPAVVLVPGMFSNRRFWLSSRHIGFAAWLAEHGHTAYIVQRRGLTGSPPCSARPGLNEHIRFDLPAVQTIVAQCHAAPAFWIGHSFGGIMVARAAARELDTAGIAGIVLFASQIERGKRMLDWPGNLLTRRIARLCGHFPARLAGLGPENEPTAAIDDACAWVVQARRQGQLQAGLAAVAAPVLALSGSADRTDPGIGCRQFIDHFASTDKTFLNVGRQSGFSTDYDHAGIVVSKSAQSEIWPYVGSWLAARGPA